MAWSKTGNIRGPGADLGYNQVTANTATGTLGVPADIVTVTFTAPSSGIVWLEAAAYSVGQGSTTANLIAAITDNSNNVIMQQFLGNVAGGGFSVGPHVKGRVSGLTPGTSYTYKFRASTSAAAAGSVLASATYPCWIRAASV